MSSAIREKDKIIFEWIISVRFMVIEITVLLLTVIITVISGNVKLVKHSFWPTLNHLQSESYRASHAHRDKVDH